MSLRTSMASIISEVRQYGQAAPDDVFDGVTYWSDQQLQTIADRNSKLGKVKAKQVDPDGLIFKLVVPKTIAVENDIRLFTTDTVIEVTADFTYDHDTQELTFAAPQTPTEYFVYGRIVRIYNALAELWQNKADQRFNYIDWKAQNNKMNMTQEYQHCIDRALYYRGKTIRNFERNGRGAWFF